MKNLLKFFLELEFLHDTNRVRRKTNLIRLVLIILFILTSSVSLQLGVTQWIEKNTYNGAPIWIILFFWISWAGLYVGLQRLGYQLAGLIIIGYLSLVGYWLSWHWGVDAPFGLIVYLLSVVLAGLLFGSRAIVTTTILHGIFLVWLSPLQAYGLITVDQSWKQESVHVGDGLGAIAMLSIVTFVVWIFNREVEIVNDMANELNRTINHERNNLERLAIRRTAELRQSQQSRLVQLYQLAELGKSSAELFHELTNSLSVATLQIKQLIYKTKLASLHRKLQELDKTIQQLAKYVTAVRTQVSDQKTQHYFQPIEALRQSTTLMKPKAKNAQVQLRLITQGKGLLSGESVKLSQVITNLIANAIDAYPIYRRPSTLDKSKRQIIIKLSKRTRGWNLTIRDFGQGIPNEQRKYLFEPFFTTKTPDKGIGLGLPISREIIEKRFGGWIKVISHKNSGTTFSVWLPTTSKSPPPSPTVSDPTHLPVGTGDSVS